MRNIKLTSLSSKELRDKIIAASEYKVVELDLSFNNLTSLPKEIELLDNIVWLNLNDNKFINLPEELINLPNLERLNISNNNIKEFPSDLCGLLSL